MSPAEYDKAKTQLEHEMKLGLSETSKSQWVSNLPWERKSDRTLHLCINYSRVNDITVKDKYPIPKLEDVVANLQGERFISLLDITTGFNNLYIHPNDREYLAFMSPLGLLRPVRMPFGLANGLSAFQREMDTTLKAFLAALRLYIDDISGGAKDKQQLHDLIFVSLIFNFFKRKFVGSAPKAHILAKWLPLLGRAVGAMGMRPNPAEG